MTQYGIHVEREKLLSMARKRKFSPAQYVLLSALVDFLWDPMRPTIPLSQTQLADELNMDAATTRAMVRALRDAGVLRSCTSNATRRGRIVINPVFAYPLDPEVQKRQQLHWQELG